MILAADIGNTSMTFALIQGKKITRVFTIETQMTSTQLRRALVQELTKFRRRKTIIHDVVICSVVPSVVPLVKLVFKKILGKTPLIIGMDFSVPIKNKYENPRQVGQDRLVCAYAVKILYGSPAIVIDSGTAITFDVVSSKGEYEGGMIIPGIRLSAESLFAKTALLPKIESIQMPKSLIGKNTKESILSGLFNGYGAMSCGLISRISSQFKTGPKVIMTGGYTKLMKPFMGCGSVQIDDDLVFKGIELVYREFSSAK
jgi:type III pantothenate kinase